MTIFEKQPEAANEDVVFDGPHPPTGDAAHWFMVVKRPDQKPELVLGASKDALLARQKEILRRTEASKET